MALPAFFQGYVDDLRALGWTVELTADRIALYSPSDVSATARRHPVLMLCHDPVAIKRRGEMIPAVRPYHLYNRRFYSRRAFRTLESAALVFLKEAFDIGPRVCGTISRLTAADAVAPNQAQR